MIRAVLVALLLAVATPSLAVEPDEMLADPVLEQRAREISRELRCLVCQNQSIDDSDADLARDLRLLVRERLLAGDSDAQVIDYIAARYGDFVLLDPPVKPATWALWFGPALLLLAAGLATLRYLRRREGAAAPAPLDPAERRRLDTLIGEAGGTQKLRDRRNAP
jgi:cytochrome c-type biogenesis protein CcmH